MKVKRICSLFLTLMFALILSSSNATNNNNLKSNNQLKWKSCKNKVNKDFLCAKISVPLDYKYPQLGNIKLSISLHPASERSRGYLLFNFGGPWADNVNILPSITEKRLTPAMVKQFDLLVINPRGVSPNVIQCNTQNPARLREINEGMKKIFAQGNARDAEVLYSLAKQKQEICQYNNIYKYTNTTNTVQDIEKLRDLLHAKKLNFYMASYGTRLGLAYLVKYPQHVRKIILDGNIAPSNQLMSLIGGRAFGANIAFNDFFQNCVEAGSQCVLNKLSPESGINNPTNLINQFNRWLINVSKSRGIPTNSEYSNKPITTEMIKNLMCTEMQPSNWRNLSQAIYEAEKDNSGNKLMKIYMTNTGYDPNSDIYSTDNNATRSSVICEDYTIPDFNNKSTWLKFINRINSKYSEIGTISTLWLSPMCIKWNVKSTPTLPNSPKIKLKEGSNSPQVLIIGNSKDPMTPFENAIAVKNYLGKFQIKSSIIKWNGVSHTALITDSPLSSCVFQNVDKFLLGKNFDKFIACTDWKNPFIREIE